MNIWSNIRRNLLWIGISVSLAAVTFFIIYSVKMTSELALQERERMELWADATRQIVAPDIDAMAFPLQVIENNTNIPAVLTDSDNNPVFYRNIPSVDSSRTLKIIDDIIANGKCIEIQIDPDTRQYIYYRDSTLLQKITIYPWVLFSIILVFIILVTVAVVSTSQMEQNRLWVGLTKETAHQLGTPLSSLEGWIDYLTETDTPTLALQEMKRDVQRLQHITSRFSKVGTRPVLQSCDLGEIIMNAVHYMRPRLSSRISIEVEKFPKNINVDASEPLIQWVLENLMRNAADAMKGSGDIKISVVRRHTNIDVLISDTGCGIERKHWRSIFNPGFTTKKQGWGMGLALSKRIVEKYHGGKIEVEQSVRHEGTIFRVALPRANVSEQNA